MSKEDLRRQIDRIDDQILRFLNRRAKIACQTLKFKKDCYDPVREQAVIERLSAQNTGPLPQQGLRAVYREILSACRDLPSLSTMYTFMISCLFPVIPAPQPSAYFP